MPTISALYEHIGRCVEVAQQMEYFVASASMAADGLRSGSHADVRDEGYVKLVSRLDRLTLGQALKELETRVTNLGELKPPLAIALDARNRLAHQILARRTIAEMNAVELDEFAAELLNIDLDLKAGRSAAFAIAKALVYEGISRKVADLLEDPPAGAI